MNLHYKSSTIINISHPCFILLTSPQPELPANRPPPRVKKKKIVVKCSLWYLPRIGFRTPMDTKIHRCSNPLYKWCSAVVLCIHGFCICRFNQPQMEFSLHLVVCRYRRPTVYIHKSWVIFSMTS